MNELQKQIMNTILINNVMYKLLDMGNIYNVYLF